MSNLRKSIYIDEDEEMEAVLDMPFDFTKSIRVHNRDSREFSKEVEREGWDAVCRRLEKEGLGNSKTGYVYEVPIR